MENKPASLLVVPLGKALGGIPYPSVVDRWPATHTRASYSALIASRDRRMNKHPTKYNTKPVVKQRQGPKQQ